MFAIALVPTGFARRVDPIRAVPEPGLMAFELVGLALVALVAEMVLVHLAVIPTVCCWLWWTHHSGLLLGRLITGLQAGCA